MINLQSRLKEETGWLSLCQDRQQLRYLHLEMEALTICQDMTPRSSTMHRIISLLHRLRLEKFRLCTSTNEVNGAKVQTTSRLFPRRGQHRRLGVGTHLVVGHQVLLLSNMIASNSSNLPSLPSNPHILRCNRLHGACIVKASGMINGT